MKKAKKKQVEPKQRNTYTLDEKGNAKRYYLIGLTLIEISTLSDAPVRTIEKWQIIESWKQQRETTQIHIKANDLYLSGKTYKEIATILNKSTATIWRYLTTVRNERKKSIATGTI
jgi:uncharacterized protein YjcR